MSTPFLNKSNIKIDPNTITLEELRFKRAEALIHLELCKARLANDAMRVKQKTREQGLRGLIFNQITNKRLRIVDYLLIGFKGAQLLLGFRKRRKRH